MCIELGPGPKLKQSNYYIIDMDSNKMMTYLACRLSCMALLCDEAQLPERHKAKLRLPLMGAVVKRLAQEPQHLRLHPQCVSGLHSRASDCPGCSDCHGLEWQWKAEAVATLIPLFCEPSIDHQGLLFCFQRRSRPQSSANKQCSFGISASCK